MATKLELLIELDSKGAVQGVKSLNTQVDGLSKTSKTAAAAGQSLTKSVFLGTLAYNVASRSLRELVDLTKESVKAFMEQERVDKALATSLEITGRPVKELTEHFKNYASELQKQTTFGDEAIEKAQALLIQLTNLDRQGLDQATRGTIGLASVMGMDLNSAANLVAKAMAGNASALSRYGIQVDMTKSKEEQRAEVMGKLESFYARATAETETYSGKLAQLSNSWGDLKEVIGESIVNNHALRDSIDWIVDGLTNWLNADKELIAAEEKLHKQQNQDADLLGIVAVNAKMAYGEMAKLIETYKGNTDAVVRDIETGQLGVKMMYALKDAKVEHIANLEKQKKAEELASRGTNTLIEKTGKLAKAEKTLTETLEERWATMQKNIAQDEAYAAFVEAKLGPAIDSHSDAWADNVDMVKAAKEEQARYEETLGKAIPTIEETSIATKKWYEDAQDLTAGLTALANVFDDLIPGLGKVIGGIMGAYEATTKFAAASAAGTATLGGFLGMAGAVIGGFMALSNAVDAYTQGQQRAFIKGMNDGIKVSDEMAEKIRVLAQEVANLSSRSEEFYEKWNMPLKFNIDPSWDEFAAATSKLLGDIIAQTDMSIETFDEWAQRTRDILADYDRGMFTAAETTLYMGKAFSALITKAKDLGTEGSESLIAMFEDLANRGMRVKEIQDYINANWKAGLEGYKKYLEGDFSTATIGVFEYLLAYEKKVGANQALVDGIEGITQALIGMSNVVKLTEEEFDKFEMAGRDAYDALRKKGFTEKESLMQLQPMLSRLIYLQKEYGLEIDAATQALIDKAKADGIDLSLVKSQDELFGDMAGSLAELVDIFRNVFPKAIDETTNAFKKLNDVSDNFDPDNTYNPKHPDEQPAATGWEGWVAGGSNRRFLTGETEPEYVSITPMSKMRGSDAAPGGGGSKTVNLNIVLAGTITPESAADAITTAYRNNTRGLRSLLEN